MTFEQPAITAQLVYDEQSQTWIIAATDEVLPPVLIHAEIRRQALLTSTMFDGMTTAMYAGEITIPAWQNAMLDELKEGHIADAMFANGGAELSPQALARLETTIAKEAEFLTQFAEGVSDGSVSQLQARARAKQYAKAMEQSYWNEWKQGVANSPELSHLPLLNNSPGDGQTQCRGNCQCILEVTPNGINWLQFPAEHCPDCDALASGGPYRSE